MSAGSTADWRGEQGVLLCQLPQFRIASNSGEWELEKAPVYHIVD
jgi:hypothetical protein